MVRMQSDEREDPLPAQDAGPAGIQSFEIGLKLLSLMAELSDGTQPPMLKTLSAAAGMPPAKVHRYMVSLVRTQYAERDPATGRYRLGPMARQLGIAAISRMDVLKVAGARLAQLCAEIEQSVALAIWTYHGPVMVATEDLREPVTISTRVGQIMPLLTSATGRVFGAWLPARMVERLIQQELAAAYGRDGATAIRTMAQVDALFQQTREAGVAWTQGGLNATVNALAAPVFDYRGTLVAALASLGPANSFDIRTDGALAIALKAAAGQISQELGYRD